MGARIGPCAAARAAGDGLGQTRRSCPPSVKGRASDAIALDYADCGKLGDLGRVVDRAFVGKARARHDRGATGADDADGQRGIHRIEQDCNGDVCAICTYPSN